ncbi:hypothetical protein [Nitrobacter sp. TKz-YC02]|uniref:hypothetical protein n=1 Tax=Nitrobacter sp. TKz-YC02 TaxID=3398704 RepID=UPI003CED2952
MNFSQRAVEAAARAIAETRGAIWTRRDHTVSANFDHDAAIAALSAALAVDGLCLVPKEPTEGMMAAGGKKADDIFFRGDGRKTTTLDAMKDVWSAMVAAANDGKDYSPPQEKI